MVKFVGTFLSLISTAMAAIPLTMLSDPTARCLDGTLSGYYFEKAQDQSSPESNKWVIYLQGGGECDTKEYCYSKLDSDLGSSKYFPTSMGDSSGWYWASAYCPYNPMFCEWNHVNVPYCSQDLHSGTRSTRSADTWGLYFSGHLVLKAILDQLDQEGLTEATEIILTGVSAGGLGTWMNVDYVAGRYPNARVTGATIAGFYYFAEYYTGPNATDPEDQLADFTRDGIANAFELYGSFVDESCREAMVSAGQDVSACMMANYSLPYIESAMYAVQAQSDQVVLNYHDCLPDEYKMEDEEQSFMKNWSHNMSVALSPLLSSGGRHGAFSVACYIHGSFSHSQPKINGLNYNEAFSNFYFNHSVDGAAETYNLEDDCGVMCNPSCPDS